MCGVALHHPELVATLTAWRVRHLKPQNLFPERSKRAPTQIFHSRSLVVIIIRGRIRGRSSVHSLRLWIFSCAVEFNYTVFKSLLTTLIIMLPFDPLLSGSTHQNPDFSVVVTLTSSAKLRVFFSVVPSLG